MSNRNSNNQRPATRGKTNSRTTPSRNNQSRSRSHQKKGSNISGVKCILVALVILIVILLARNNFNVNDTIEDITSLSFLEIFLGEQHPEITFSDDFYAKVDYLALLYPEGRNVYYLDVMTIQASDWEYEKMLIGGHDHLDRTLPIIAYLSQRNLGRSESRGSQSHQPTGWQQNRHEVEGTDVWVKNRGHLIAYTLSFNFNAYGQFAYGYLGSDDDPVNLFTQTAHSNQNIMTYYEGQIRSILANGGEVVFKSAPIFRENELIARGIWLQVASTCEELIFSVFIFNEQPGIIIDHATGENWVY